MSLKVLINAGAKPRRQNNSVACVVVYEQIGNTNNMTPHSGYFSCMETAECVANGISKPTRPMLFSLKDVPLYIYDNRLDSFRKVPIDVRGADCGKKFLEHFSQDVENQNLSKDTVERFKQCLSYSDLWKLINRYTVIQG